MMHRLTCWGRKRSESLLRWVTTCLSIFSVTACSYPVNPQLKHYSPTEGYRYEALNASDGAASNDKNFVALTFSGGGTRAAAFAYGVLQELQETRVGTGHSLLDDVDVISSVSGGSFAAAYYALFGRDAFFADFPHAVLYREIERDLLLRLLAPWNWPKLLSPSVTAQHPSVTATH